MSRGPLVRIVCAALLALATVPILAETQTIKNAGKAVAGKVESARKKVVDEMTFTPEEQRQLGSDISAKLREKYGVVQNVAVHRYVTLVGTALARDSERHDLKWTFIVLDTDAVNAFAAPGGFIHVTKGALALMQNEAELADVLGHEIAHVVENDTIQAIKTSKVASAPGKAITFATRNDFLENMSNRGFSSLLNNEFSSGDESDADETGVILANKIGYSPAGLGAFLTRLQERNRTLTDPSGMYKSHPETTKRVRAIDRVIHDESLLKSALGQARYKATITYKPVPVAAIPQVPPPAATAPKAEPEPEKKEGGMGKFGLGGIKALGKEKQSTSSTSATGSRGVNPDRDAKGGPNKAVVVVNVTSDQVTTFVKGIGR